MKNFCSPLIANRFSNLKKPFSLFCFLAFFALMNLTHAAVFSHPDSTKAVIISASTNLPPARDPSVNDVESPTAVCPANIPDVILDAAGFGTLPANIGDGSSQNYVTETSLAVNVTCDDVGVSVQVVLTATDGIGDTDEITCYFNVVDNIAPVAVCAPIPDVVLDTIGNGILPANAARNGSSTDNCSGWVIETSPELFFTCANAGVQSVILTATDPGGNATIANCTFNVVGCSTISDLTGRVFADLDCNNIFNGNDVPLVNHVVRKSNGTPHAFTNSDGNYHGVIYANIATTINSFPPTNYTSQPASYTITSAGGQSFPNRDFALCPTSSFHNVSVRMTGLQPTRPGFQHEYYICYENKGTQQENATLNFNLSGSAAPYATIDEVDGGGSNVGGLVTWSLTNVPLFMPTCFYVKVTMLPATPLGSLLDSHAEINLPSGPDAEPSDNVHNLTQTVVGSFDPNDKTVNRPNVNIVGSENGTDLDYVVRFQNTGTYPAEFIELLDTLKADLDITTFEMLAASHPYTLSFLEANTLKWRFDNINLPPSVDDEPGSHGFVSFRIRTVDNLQLTDTVENRAAIYFDYNAPIITNTATTQFFEPETVCDGLDNDFDILIDEGFDLDYDGYTTCNGDCDDNNASVHPTAIEICGNNIDENCNGMADDPCPSSGCANSVLTNSGFENGSTGWTLSNVSVAANNPHSGSKAAKLCGQAGNGNQKKAAAAGQTWSASVWADANGGGTNKTVALRFLNTSNTVLATVAQTVPGNTNGYLLFNMTGSAPAGTAWAQVYWSKGQGGGCLYVDDWCLQQVPPQQQAPPALVLFDGSETQKYNFFPSEIFTLSPNPAKDELFVFGHQNGADEDFSFVVTDFLGKEIREVKGKFEADNLFKISLDGLANGMYCLQIRGNGIRSVTRKFVVVR